MSVGYHFDFVGGAGDMVAFHSLQNSLMKKSILLLRIAMGFEIMNPNIQWLTIGGINIRLGVGFLPANSISAAIFVRRLEWTYNGIWKNMRAFGLANLL